jgi:hypothetical protein
MKNYWANILTTKFRWIINQFLSLFFMKFKVKKHLPSFKLPITIAIDNLWSWPILIWTDVKEVDLWPNCLHFGTRIVIEGRFYGCMVVGLHNHIEKNTCRSINPSSISIETDTWIGFMLIPKQLWFFRMLNYVDLFLFNFNLHPKLGVNDPNNIHNL